jgi:hypothetical protein
MYECHGWTDKFQLFQFSFSSSHTVKSSVRRTEVRQKKSYGQTQTHRNTDPIQSNTFNGKNLLLNLLNTNGTIQSKHAVLLTRSVSMQCNAMQCNAIQCNAMQCNQLCACNVEVQSVRPWNGVSQSFFFFIFFFQNTKMTKSC